MVYDAGLGEDLGWRVSRVRMWENGHSFEEIDAMGVQDVSDVIGYWSGKNKGEERLRRMSQRHSRTSSKN